MNKWKFFHWLQKQPPIVRNAIAKGWTEVEWSPEQEFLDILDCGCTEEYTTLEGYYGYPPNSVDTPFTVKQRIPEEFLNGRNL